MKRAEKIALLTKIVNGEVNEGTRRQLSQSNGPGGIVLIYQPGDANPSPDDAVSFEHNGQRVTMPYKDIQAFTRYDPLTIFFIPDKGRLNTRIR